MSVSESLEKKKRHEYTHLFSNLWVLEHDTVDFTVTERIASVPMNTGNWNSLHDSPVSPAESAEDSVAKFTLLMRARDSPISPAESAEDSVAKFIPLMRARDSSCFIC